MRMMFVAYLLVICVGLTYFLVVSLAHG